MYEGASSITYFVMFQLFPVLLTRRRTGVMDAAYVRGFQSSSQLKIG